MAYILVVDDEPLIALVLQESLSDTGHTVVTAADGLVALRLLGHSPVPDVVVLDLNLPYVSGSDIVRHMRKQPALQAVPVIIITASIAPGDIPPPGSFQKLISKPFDLADVCDSVTELLSPYSPNQGS